jgi:hypothetical protein
MDLQLLIICILTFIIHLIGTLAYAARIAGVRTRRIAISFSLFNILILVSRTSNSFQGPFLAKRIENNLAGGMAHGLLADFRWMLWSATLATIVGALLIPTFQRTLQPRGPRFSGEPLDASSLAPHIFQRRPGTTQRRSEPTGCSQYHENSCRRRYVTLGYRA